MEELTYFYVSDILPSRLGRCVMESYATAKGQIVIPASLRRKFGIKEGTRIEIEADERTQSIVLSRSLGTTFKACVESTKERD